MWCKCCLFQFPHLLKLWLEAYLLLIPLQLSTIVGSSISLLLAFKISQSYDQWWEARKTWGGIVIDSRTLVLQICTFVPDSFAASAEPDLPLRTVARYQITWCYYLGETLRGLNPALLPHRAGAGRPATAD